MDAAQLRSLVARRPDRTALLFDFDGTLAPIVAHPDAATPADGAIDLLVSLARHHRRVAVVSGRPCSFLEPLIPTEVDVSALYGLESRIDGVREEHEDAERWRAVVLEVAEDPTIPDGVIVETKGLSLTLHFRTDPGLEGVVRTWADAAAARTGLLARGAKASVELHPPIDADKGTATIALAADCETVVFVGDDLGDLPAFAALDALQSEGVATVKIASGGDELPPEVAAAADLVVGGPDDVLALFATLV